MLKKSFWLLHPNRWQDVRKINVVILTLETVGYISVLSISLSLSVKFSIQNETMDVARSAPQGAHYYADVTYLGSEQEPYLTQS